MARCLRSRASALALDGATSPCAGPPPKGEPATGNFLLPKQQRSRPAPSQVASPARCGGDCTARRWPRAALPAPPAPGEWAPAAGKYTLADLVGWLSQAGNSTKFFALGANLCSRGAVRSRDQVRLLPGFRSKDGLFLSDVQRSYEGRWRSA